MGAQLIFPGLRLARLYRLDLGTSAGAGQPTVWTVVDFEADDADATPLAEAIASVLSPQGGWYCDFRVGDDRFVVYPDKIFRYSSGDPAGRAAAEAYGRSVGVPDHQLDWPE